MRNKDKSTYRKIEFRRKESFYLLVRGLEVGIVSGLIAVLYRFLLSLAENYLMKIISYVKGNPVKIADWLFCFNACQMGAAGRRFWYSPSQR